MAATDSPSRRLLKQRDSEDQARLDAFLARSRSSEATGDPHNGEPCNGRNMCRHDTGHPMARQLATEFAPRGGYWTFKSVQEGPQFHGSDDD